VGILDEAFAAIATAKANTQKNLQNTREVLESEVEAIFMRRGDNWNEKPLAELCTVNHGFAFKSVFFTDSGEYVLLTPGNFYGSGGYRDRGNKQKFYEGDIPDGFILERGDLLVAMTEQAAGLLGSPILVPESDKFLHNQRLGLVERRAGVPWDNEFFFHVFNLKRVRNEIHDSGTGVKVVCALQMNEAETRAEHVDPALAAAGWGVVGGSRIRREYPITPGCSSSVTTTAFWTNDATISRRSMASEMFPPS
jgi:type I restriction enzyme S subunit